ncbi:MAG: hypothetical protein ACP5M5_13060, partial [Acidibrevibacterium sp.]|uniref:hypothetical protein n=1 Tax=Acidibrevibacterium sp. TaxID=2606776 RepID=UPI003CFBF4F6
ATSLPSPTSDSPTMTLVIGMLGLRGTGAGIGAAAGSAPREDENSRKTATTTTTTTMAMTIIPPVDIDTPPKHDIELTEAHAHRMRGSPASVDRGKTRCLASKRSQMKANGKQNFPRVAGRDLMGYVSDALAWLRTSPA